MIPPFFPEDSAPGEQAVYRALATSPDTDDWIVLHSLNIAEHVRTPEGEADFVIIAPQLGLMVIEVKSHERIDFRDGAWYLGRHPPTTRGPFKQASEAMHSIRKGLLKKMVDLRSLPTLSAVWFTAVRARTMLKPSPEWAAWQVLDSEDLKRPIAALRRAFRGGIAHLDETFAGFSYGGVGPDESKANRIGMLLRPNFELGVVAGDMRAVRERHLVRFVAEQYAALDAMADNRAVFFSGPAGSGKTFLAMEAARREITMGHRGRLVCFNRLLGRRLMGDMPDNPKLTVGTFYRQLLELAGVTAPDTADGQFWRVELPERALEALLNSEQDPACDFLIIDEVQDLLREPYLEVLDLMVRGGLGSGRVLLFGDFERQAIYDDGHGRQLLKERMPHVPSHRLTMNCRNLPRIGYSVNIFSGLKPGYQKFRRVDDGANPVWLKYQRGGDQSPHLRAAVQALRDENFELGEILVLSPLGRNSVVSTTTDPWLRGLLEPADGRPPKKGKLRYATIHAYKGLEAPAVVVTDLDRELVPNFESVLYIGLTRATDRLYGVIEESTGLAGLGGTL